ncbi:hypothetical protein AOXY_G3056 [Acipenser oxyrinchus oxyrinchus]|uniref:Uncharacterized protein n=1 Tax=Acipenser oxyrinchus oxyrinchus TaxID=40147 RepID=A0AAD8GJU0_ACIOX|nr:hypothetical protein AOXY_G3056 [Acipenser oxyrinchus oxyrinchus]
MSTNIKELLKLSNSENLGDNYTPKPEAVHEAKSLSCFCLELEAWGNNYKGENKIQVSNYVSLFLDIAYDVIEDTQDQSCGEISAQPLHALKNFLEKQCANLF